MVVQYISRKQRRLSLLGGIGVIVAGGAISVPALAQTAPGQTPTAYSTAQDQSGEIVVTAQKRSEKLQDVPISVSVLGGAQLDQSTVKGVEDALTAVPGVAFSEYANTGGGVVSVRGVSAPQTVFGGSSPVAYYLDSVPFGLVQSAIVPDANVYDLDRVEALRGPQGTLYGASALAGVVRILTKDPEYDAFGLKFRVADSGTYNGGDNYRGDLAVNVPIIDDKLAIRAVVDYQDLSGWISTPLKKDANDTKARNYRFKLGAKPIDGLTIVASAWLSRENSGGVSAGSTPYFRDVGIEEPHSNDFDAYSLKTTYDLHSFDLTSNTSYLKFKGDGIIDATYPFPFLMGAPLPAEFGFNAKIFSEEFTATSKGTGPWRWTIGAFYRNARDAGLVSIPDLAYLLDFTSKSESYAVFGEVTRLFADDKLGITVGGRYFHDSVTALEGKDAPPSNPPNYYDVTKPYSAVTPRVVLTWHPIRTISAYASYSQGFRSGSPQAYYTVNGVPGLSPDVKPDKLYNYEVGVKSDTRALSLDAAFYYMKWTDIQQSITVPVNGVEVAAISNGHNASGFGVDLGVTVRPMHGLDFGGTFSWNSLESDSNTYSGGALLFAKGDRLNFSPKDNASLFADYSRELGGDYKGILSASGSYTDRQCSRANSALDNVCGDKVLTTRASLALESSKGWKLTLFGDNLNNFKGVIVGDSYFGPQFLDRIRPRTIGLQFDYHL